LKFSSTEKPGTAHHCATRFQRGFNASADQKLRHHRATTQNVRSAQSQLPLLITLESHYQFSRWGAHWFQQHVSNARRCLREFNPCLPVIFAVINCLSNAHHRISQQRAPELMIGRNYKILSKAANAHFIESR